MASWDTIWGQLLGRKYHADTCHSGTDRLGTDRWRIASGQALGRSLGLLGLTGFCWLMASAPAFAGTEHQWQLTGQSPDGLAQQYVDLNSMRSNGNPEQHQWIIDSYFIDRRFNGEVRADYVTVYDCDRYLYKDMNSDGNSAAEWGDAQADPFNLATMTYVCQYLGY